MLIPYLTATFPAWVTMILVAATAIGSYFYHKWNFDTQASDMKDAMSYLAGKLDAMNTHLIEQGLDPLDMDPEESV